MGAGQAQADGDAPDPIVLLAQAIRTAAPARLIERADSVRVVRIVSRGYPDPGRLLAQEIGATPRETVYTHHGGQNPQALVSEAAWDIFRGANDVVVIGGAECWRTRRAFRRRGEARPWLAQDTNVSPTRLSGEHLELANDNEQEIGFGDPLQAYPLIEIAHRAHLGLTPAQHMVRISELWARFSEVGATNPYACLAAAHAPEEIRRTSEANRMIGYPYTKLLVANNDVDQAAGLVMCSVDQARRAGVPPDEWLFLHGSGLANDTPAVSNRMDLARSPAIRAAARAALSQAGVGVDDLAHLDVYSCFPCAVEIAAAEMGVAIDRQLTVTGGLTFAGGPWNNYTSHAIAAMRRVLLEDRDAYGMCTANGGLLTKHAVGIYSTRPPTTEPRRPEVWRPHAARRAEPDYRGAATVEAYTVMYDRTGQPASAYVACRTPADSRTLVRTADPALMQTLIARDACGDTVTVGDRSIAPG